jgi:isopenicillin N synthase-like dioxygenase
VQDLKEFWHIGRELEPGDPLEAFMPANVWPAELADFRPTFDALFAAFEASGLRILQAIALHLGLERDFFAPTVEKGNSVLRLLHYPPVPPEAEGAVRAAAHEDINAITLLLGAEEAGLELLARDGRWLPVSPPPGALAVNIGDMLQRLTAHRLRSTTHRVVNPSGAAARRARYSMPFFLHFRPDFLIEPLASCREGGVIEPTVTADQYLQQRLREINLA